MTKSKFFIRLGQCLILFSIFIVLLTFLPVAKNEVTYDLSSHNQKSTSEINSKYQDFGLVIPKLGIDSKVIPEVDPANPKIYQKALTKGVAHAKGSALPDQNGNVFIFSHSSANFYEALHYNSIFYLLNKLEKGDKIYVFYLGKKYTYEVEDKKFVNPNTPFGQEGDLTLMTCWPPGTSFNRLLIVAILT